MAISWSTEGDACWDIGVGSWRSSRVSVSSVFSGIPRIAAIAGWIDCSVDLVRSRIRSCRWLLESSGAGVG